MLEDKRIKTAESNIRRYLDDGIICKVEKYRDEILDTYKRNYRESLDLAKKLFDENISSLWIVVISYYSMYYITNAVLYKIGYKITSDIGTHKISADALIVFIRNKLKKSLLEEYEEAEKEALELIGVKTDEVIDSYHKELKKRSDFQYKTTEEIKRTKAETSFKRAKTFVFEMEKLI